MPGPRELFRSTSTLSRSASQATRRSALGLIRSAVTEPRETFSGCWSRAAASSARHGVIRVHARSEFPGEYDVHWAWMALPFARVAAAASVTRRWASRPNGSSAGTSGGSDGHQMATGESGSSSGSTTDSACLTTSPFSRISAVSPVQPPPVPTCALTCGAPRASPRITPSTRAGCSCDACLATAIASPAPSSSTTTTRVITMLIAGLPARTRDATNSAAIPAALVFISSITVGPSWSSPGSSVAGQHRVCRGRPPRPGLVLVGLALPRPVVEHRVEDLPRPLHLCVPGEQRRAAAPDAEDQPFVGLRARLGERAAVGEVHVHVADLHLGAGYLRAEPQGHPLVGLDADHQGVVGELLGGRARERLVRRWLEHH